MVITCELNLQAFITVLNFILTKVALYFRFVVSEQIAISMTGFCYSVAAREKSVPN